MPDDLNAEDVRALLQSVEADTTRTSPNRESIRSSVLATFDEANADNVESVADVVSLESLDDDPQRSIWSRRAVGWAAAVVAVALAGAMLLLSKDGTQVETALPPPVSILSLDGTDLPTPLLPGRVRATMIAEGMSFDAPSGLAVVAANQGQLTLALADDSSPGAAGQLLFVELELSDWEGRLRELADAGDVDLKEIGVIVDGRATTRLDVTITNEALAALSCVAGEPCLSLDGGPPDGPAALWAGSDNRIVEIGRTEDSMVLAIEVSQQFQGPLSRLAAEVVSTASVSSD